jgi:hypothetical protein
MDSQLEAILIFLIEYHASRSVCVRRIRIVLLNIILKIKTQNSQHCQLSCVKIKHGLHVLTTNLSLLSHFFSICAEGNFLLKLTKNSVMHVTGFVAVFEIIESL